MVPGLRSMPVPSGTHAGAAAAAASGRCRCDANAAINWSREAPISCKDGPGAPLQAGGQRAGPQPRIDCFAGAAASLGDFRNAWSRLAIARPEQGAQPPMQRASGMSPGRPKVQRLDHALRGN